MNGRPALGVLVPCRNERDVIERKLRNLALARWPEGNGPPHLLVIVDDGSEDGTARHAQELAPRLFGADAPTVGPRVEVVTNGLRPGKAGAVSQGLALLGNVDIVVLSDADVIVRPDALEEIARAFAADETLGMACGTQEFVRDLHGDGTPTAADGAEPVPAPGRYDRWTAVVRAAESRSGRLFSVHGQLLAWRSDLEIAPSPGIAADDLDLMRQVRARGFAVRKLDAARFLEVKTPAGPGRRQQEIRRARAYVQVARLCRLPPTAPRLERLQFALYRWLPLAAPWVALLALAALVVLGVRLLPGAGGFALLAGLALAAAWPPGRHAVRLLHVIAVATLLESSRSLDDRWEMERA